MVHYPPEPPLKQVHKIDAEVQATAVQQEVPASRDAVNTLPVKKEVKSIGTNTKAVR
jgi:hypothetical protein